MSRKSTKNNQSQVSTHSSSNNEVNYDILNVHSWDVRRHNCGLAKVNKSGQGKSAPLTYNKKRFYLMIPKMYCPFGASKPKPKPGDKEPENPSWSVQMSFGDDELCKIFQSKVNEFDQFIIDQACQPEYQISWLGASKTKPFIREIVESKYNPMLKYVKKEGEINHEYPPFIRAQFATTFKPPYEFSCEIYDKDSQLLKASINPDADDCINKVIPNGCYCSALLAGSIWANATGFGVTWKIAQLKVFPLRGLPKGKCLVDDPDDDDDSNDNSSNDNQNDNNDENEGMLNQSVEVNDTEQKVHDQSYSSADISIEEETQATIKMEIPPETNVNSVPKTKKLISKRS